jgi:uncharacterized protein
MARILAMMFLVAVVFYFAGNRGHGPSAHRLTQSDDFLWKSFALCQLKSDPNFSCSITYIPEVMAMNGKQITLSGFIMPLETKEKFTHFLLSRRSPTCAFCPPGEPNEIVEVFLSKPVNWQEDLFTISGRLILSNNGTKGIFFQMKDAGSR